ncbi:MAG: hypothetical protein QXL82_01960 [Candidatus Aenigmatarchaeota archaeon]
MNEIDWNKFKEFLSLRSSNKTHINNLVNYAKKYGYLLNLNALDFSLEFKKITENKKTLKKHVLQALAALSKFLDALNETDFYYKRFNELRKKSGITWYNPKIPKILEEKINKNELIEKIKYFPKRLKATCILHLLTGLRTHELIYFIKNFEKLKKMKIEDAFVIELLYLRKTKKVFFTILNEKAIPLIKLAYKCKLSYWKNLKKINLKPYDFRRAFESIYDNLRSHEIDLLQGRVSEELIINYTRDLENLAKKVNEKQKEILSLII